MIHVDALDFSEWHMKVKVMKILLTLSTCS